MYLSIIAPATGSAGAREYVVLPLWGKRKREGRETVTDKETGAAFYLFATGLVLIHVRPYLPTYQPQDINVNTILETDTRRWSR